MTEPSVSPDAEPSVSPDAEPSVSPDASVVAPRSSEPTGDAERIVSMDVLRGFALLGILLMNIQSFSMVSAAYINPTVMGGMSGGDYWVWLLCHVFADQKFMTIFSMLFGAGIALMAGRETARGRSPAALHYRRMGWLLVIGLAHAYLVWYGDILVVYAMCGACVFVLRKLPCWLLVVAGVVIISVASVIMLLCGLSMPLWPQESKELAGEEWSPTIETIEEETAIYRGTWLDQMPDRATTAFFAEIFGFLFILGWRAGGLMLIGMALYRWGVVTGQRSIVFYLGLVAAGVVGIALIARGVYNNFAADWSFEYSMFLGSQYNY